MDLGSVEMIGSRIISYEEKSKSPRTFLTATFIGMYSPDVFEYIPRGKVNWVLQTDVFPKLIKDGKISGCIVPGFYMNIKDGSDLNSVKVFIRNSSSI